jgi:hypothetical protein
VSTGLITTGQGSGQGGLHRAQGPGGQSVCAICKKAPCISHCTAHTPGRVRIIGTIWRVVRCESSWRVACSLHAGQSHVLGFSWYTTGIILAKRSDSNTHMYCDRKPSMRGRIRSYMFAVRNVVSNPEDPSLSHHSAPQCTTLRDLCQIHSTSSMHAVLH